MNIHVLHSEVATGRRRRIEPVGGGGALAVADESSNPLRSPLDVAGAAACGRLVAWSGTLAEGLFDADPRTWMAPGHDAFAAFCDAIVDPLRAHGVRLCFRPHARHVLSDVPSSVSFLRERAAAPFEVALAPATMLTPSMLDMLDDHLRRMFETLGGEAAMVFLEDVRVAADGEAMEAAPLGEGVLPRELIRRLIDDHLPSDTPVVLRGDDLDAGRDWLR